jgi:hypothetical protein
MADLGITVSRGVLRQLAAGQRSQLWLPVRVPDGHELEQVQCGEVAPGPASVVVRANDSHVLKRGRCPFGRVGDWLYIREQWATASDGRTRYRRDGGTLPAGQQWCSARSMPEQHARLWLLLYRLRLVRLHDAGDLDLRSQGVSCPAHDTASTICLGNGCQLHREAFAEQWDRRYGGTSSAWACNPPSWALSFTRHTRMERARRLAVDAVADRLTVRRSARARG